MELSPKNVGQFIIAKVVNNGFVVLVYEDDDTTPGLLVSRLDDALETDICRIVLFLDAILVFKNGKLLIKMVLQIISSSI